MRFRLTIFFGLFLCGTTFIALSGSNEPSVSLSEEQRAWIARHKTIHVGAAPDWAPFSYRDVNGKQAGIDIDVLEIISQRTGLKFQYFPATSWGETLRLAKEGKLDLTTSTAQTPAREEFFQFTQSYYPSVVVIVTRETDRRFNHISFLRDAEIAMPRDYATTKAVSKRLPSAHITLVPTLSDSFKRVAQKKADATIANLYATSHYLNLHPETKLAISGAIPEFEFPQRFAVRRDFPLLKDILDLALATISQDEMDKISSKHLLFGLQGSHRSALLRQRLKQVFWTAVLAGGLLLLWNYSLHIEVRARRQAEAELLATNRSLEVFSHSISHDLRAPLRAINGFSELLKEEHGNKLDADGRDLLDKLIASGIRMNSLVHDVLSFSQAVRSEPSFYKVSLDVIVRQLIGEFPTEQRAYFKVVSELPEVWGDPTLLTQCVANLLSNAIKFVPPERTPEVRIRAEQGEFTCKLWVEDNGLGIAPENQQRIFNMFERVRTAGYEGVGIGLAVVAKATERMHGRAGVESEVGRGSRFWIEIPVSGKIKPDVKSNVLKRFYKRT